MALSAEGGERTWQKRWPEWVEKARARHGDAYEYPSSARLGAKPDWKIRIVCKEHGEFLQSPRKHLFGQGCPLCSGRGTDKLSELVAKYPDWDWSGVVVTSSKGPLKLVCPDHGEFTTKFNRLMNKRDGLSPCPKCCRDSGGLARRVPHEDWVKRLKEQHGDQITLVGSVGRCQGKATFCCKDHGEFDSRPSDVIGKGSGCPRCTGVSKGETQIAEFIKGLGLEVIIKDREVLGGRELDVYVPQHKLAIEFCGVYWHGEFQRSSGYHAEKLAAATEAGITLLQVYEDEWVFSEEKVKIQILNKLGLVPSIQARKTKVVPLEWSIAENFLDEWHLAGAGTKAPMCYGLVMHSTLVAVATWGRGRFEKDKLELYRFATSGVRVVGGLGKLVKAVMKDSPCDTLVTYADLRWGTGGAYGKVGFTKVGVTRPNYSWCKGIIRYSRHHFQKHKLEKVLKTFDPDLSEAENCHRNGMWRIYDCGHSKWEMKWR